MVGEIALYKDYRDGVAFKVGAWLVANGFYVADSYGVMVKDLNTLSLRFQQQPVAILYNDPNDLSSKSFIRRRIIRPRRRWIATIYFDSNSDTNWSVSMLGDNTMGVAKNAVEGIIASIDPINISVKYILQDARVAREVKQRDYSD